jgi:CheY-like chemotaxis protein
MAQVIDNLVINAQQAMPGGGTVRISAANVRIGQHQHPHLRPGAYVRVAVSDAGVGIPRELLSRIFDPFFTTKPTGSGLGLATSHSIVSRHGGCIDVESEPGKGTTFRVYLPASHGQAPPREEPSGRRHHGTGRMLVMDDDARLRAILCKMLALFGYEPVAVADGREAIAAFSQAKLDGRPFRAVILDLTVPGAMGGSEAAVAIRQMDAAVPLFLATGYAEATIVAKPPEFGFTDSISKPFTIAELGSMLERNLKVAAT